MKKHNELYLIRCGRRITFPIVKLSPIRIEGTIRRVRLEVEGTDHKMYLIDPADVQLVDVKEHGGLIIDAER